MGALAGKRVLVTRAREQAGSTAELLRARGATAVVVPTIAIGPPSDVAPMRRAIAELATYDWIAFTSANGVEHAWNELARQGLDGAARGAAKIAAVGPGTARALEKRGAPADVIAKEMRGEGLASELLRAFGASRPRVLLLRAEVAREVLPESLRAAGCAVDVVAVYATEPADPAAIAALAESLERREIDAVLLTSGSTVDNLCDALGDRAVTLLAGTSVASIGPVTTEAAARRGVRVDVVAREATVASLVEALEAFFGERAPAPNV